MTKGVEFIKNGDNIIAIIIYNDYRNDSEREGTEYVTPNHFSQQLASTYHKAGKTVEAHVHNPVKREINFTQETLFIKSGKLKINFYDDDKNYFDARILEKGDAILLCSGGHGFEFLEDVKIIEVKQGPYLQDSDKVRFKGIENSNNDSNK